MADGQSQHGIHKAGAENRRHGDGQQGAGDRLYYIQDTHDHILQLAAVKSHGRADDDAEELGHKHGCKAQSQGISGAVEEAGKQVTAKDIRSADMRLGGAFQNVQGIHFFVGIGRQPGGKNSGQNDNNHNNTAGHGQLIPGKPLQDAFCQALPFPFVPGNSVHITHTFFLLPPLVYCAFIRGSIYA